MYYAFEYVFQDVSKSAVYQMFILGKIKESNYITIIYGGSGQHRGGHCHGQGLLRSQHRQHQLGMAPHGAVSYTRVHTFTCIRMKYETYHGCSCDV